MANETELASYTTEELVAELFRRFDNCMVATFRSASQMNSEDGWGKINGQGTTPYKYHMIEKITEYCNSVIQKGLASGELEEAKDG